MDIHGVTLNITGHVVDDVVYMTCLEFPDLIVDGKTKDEALKKLFWGSCLSLIDDVKQFEKGHINWNVFAKHVTFIDELVNKEIDSNDKDIQVCMIDADTEAHALLIEYMDKFMVFISKLNVGNLFDTKLLSKNPIKINVVGTNV